MAGRKAYSPEEFAAFLARGALAVELDRAASAGRFSEMCSIMKRGLRPASALAHRIQWRQRTASRAATLAAVWRTLARQFRAAGLDWRRNKLGPGSWSVLVKDPGGAWCEVATVSAPIPQCFDDRPHVWLDSTGTLTMTDGRSLRVAA